MRALFITNIPSPYQLKFATELRKYIEIEFWFTQRNDIAGRPSYWNLPLPENCREFRERRHWKLAPNLRREIEKFAPDIVWLGGNWKLTGWLVAYNWAQKHGRPVLAGPMERSFPGERLHKKIARDALMKLAYGDIDAFLVPGFESYDHYKYLFPKARVFMYPYAADCDSYFAHPVRSATKCVTFVTGGKMERQYRRPEVLRVFESLCLEYPQAYMVITGWGSERSRVEKIIADSPVLRERVEWWDVEAWDAIGDFYRSGHVFVTYASWGGWGLIVQETMASGMPVIAGAEISAGRFLIKDGVNGFLVHDDEELLGAFKHYLDHPEDVRIHGAMNKRIARHECISSKAPELVEILDRVIAMRKPSTFSI